MIHFACPHCQKRLFAQPDFSSLRGPCPSCGKVIVIPTVSAGEYTPDGSEEMFFEPSQQERVIDMELGPEPHTLASPASSSPPSPTSPRSPQAEFSQRFDAQLPPQNQNFNAGFGVPAPVSNPVPTVVDTGNLRPCPICAERIQVEAKRCRFCGAIFDEALRAEVQSQQAQELHRLGHMQLLAMQERNVNVWRSISVIALSFTIGWIFYLSLASLSLPEPPWPAIIFDAALLYGLYATSREMKKGPPSIFVTGALTLVVCMPINLALGMMNIDDEMMAALAKTMPPDQPKLTKEQLETVVLMIFSFVGLVFSIPLWITAMKVASLQRLRTLGARLK